ncbi:F-box domain-containing protein [Madurella fahalii]|uniref:F-box domain-containing protein n=1 Tax=Madurella fahalii TaxID=1157608 RepID=A0ABQ0GN87_9PEZI
MERQTIDSLPNELLHSILTNLPTRFLLPLVAVSRHFHSVTLRVLRQRLHRATSLPDRRLILECYHPSEKLYTPYLSCDYLYTDNLEGLDEASKAEGKLLEPTALGGGLAGVYSHFRPVEHEENRRARPRGRYTRRGQRGSGSLGQGTAAAGGGSGGDVLLPYIDVYLDSDELFSQLCAITNLVRVGPKPGLFLSHVNISDVVIRVWRAWLARQAAAGGRPQAGREVQDEDSVLWADTSRTVGLRFRVTEKDIRDEHPVLVANNEELPVAYRLEFEEVLIRAGTLLMMVEKEEAQRESIPEGKALVIASFV